MRIHIFAGYCAPLYAEVLKSRPLGGTETGVVHVARCLSELGHEVVVFTSHTAPPPAPGAPLYLPARQVTSSPPCDAFIAVQDWQGALLPVRARKRFFWTGDGAEQYVNFGFGDKRVSDALDGVLAVSQWHRDHLAEESGFPASKIFPIFNGVDLSLFEGDERRDRLRLIYTSAPYRGLELAPAIFVDLQKLVPEVEFHVFAGLDIYDRHGPFQGPERDQLDQLVRVLRQIPNCYVHGNVTQARLARELMKSGLFFYPNIFRETSCIAVLEGLAAGLPVVTSHYGALPETVGECGVTIKEAPGTPRYRELFVAACAQLLREENRWRKISQLAKARVRDHFSWDRTAQRLLAVLTSS